MKALLLRSGSASIQSSLLQGSLMGLPFVQDPCKKFTRSSRSALHFDIKSKKPARTSFRRSFSDTDLILSKITTSSQFQPSNKVSISYAPVRIEEDLVEQMADLKIEAYRDEGYLSLKENGLNLGAPDMFPQNEVFVEELDVSGGGMGKGRKVGGANGGGSGGDGNADIGAYYKQMLEADPGNPLLLRNYGKFLHEVENDYGRAEEYYGRAILASPGDGEVLSLYGKLIWETRKDQERAQCYFDQAVKACPDDCYVLGSYAHFLWDADDAVDTKTPPLVEAR